MIKRLKSAAFYYILCFMRLIQFAIEVGMFIMKYVVTVYDFTNSIHAVYLYSHGINRLCCNVILCVNVHKSENIIVYVYGVQGRGKGRAP